MTDHWATPRWLLDNLECEFGSLYDPCPLYGKDGLEADWDDPVYINPPQSDIYPWIHRAVEHSLGGGTAVLLLPVRPDARWWWHHIPEIRHFRSRLKYDDGPGSAPFSSCLVIFRGA